MSSEWQKITVEEIAAGSTSALATGPFGSSISAKYFQHFGIPVIRGSNLSADISVRLNEQGLVFITPEKAHEFKRSTVTRGDLVFTCWGTINQVGLIDRRSKYDCYVISNKQMKLTVNPLKADARFIYYVFSGPKKQAEIIYNSIGSSVPGFNLGQFRKHELFLPPLYDQVAIANFLDIFDNRICLLHQTNATLQAIAQALFKSWFVDFDPVRAKLDGRVPDGIDEATAALFSGSFEESEVGLVPKGWRVCALDEIALFLNGLAMQKYPPTEDSSIPVIKIAQLRKGDTNGADRAGRNIKPEYFVQNGDVLFSWSGSLEVEIWCGGEGALNQHLFKVTSNTFPKWFYYLWTKHHLEDFRQIAASKATTMGHIQRRHLSQAKVLVPPDELIVAIGSFLAPLFERFISTALQVQSLTVLRDTLLPRLISGQLRLPEAETILEEAIA